MERIEIKIKRFRSVEEKRSIVTKRGLIMDRVDKGYIFSGVLPN